MFYIYLGVFTFFIMIIWGILAIITIHSYKFKNFNPKITLFIKMLFWIFFILTIIGYILIFYNMELFSKKIEINVEKNHIQKEVSY
jgi:drug/metabolite transporter (DMT)-like permease